MSRYALAAACILTLWSAAAGAQTTTVLDPGAGDIAAPLLIVAPDYPADVPTGKEAVRIKVEGTVTSKGEFIDPRFEAGEGDEAFVAAVRKVIGMWRFLPAVADCRAVERPSHMYVWFEKKDGKPSVAVSAPPRPAAAQPPGTKPMPQIEYDVNPYPIAYPDLARRKEIEGTAIILMKVARSGEVLETHTRLSLPISDFAGAMYAAIHIARFKPLGDQWTGETICVELMRRFCLPPGRQRGFASPLCKR